MYYLTRLWKKEEEVIDLSDSGKISFSTYLSDRIGTEGVLPGTGRRRAEREARRVRYGAHADRRNDT